MVEPAPERQLPASMTEPDRQRSHQSPPGHDARGPAYAQRRRFLKWMIRLGYGAFAVAFALPALALRSLTQEVQSVASGDRLVFASGERAGSAIMVDALAPNSAVQAFPEGKTDNQNNLIEIVRLQDGADPAIVAYSAICTHLGCSVVAQLDDEGNIACPCHASIFDPVDGAAVVSGPADRPLPELPITIGTDGVIAASGTFDAPIGPQ